MDIQKLLHQIKNNEMSIEQAEAELKNLPYEDLGFAKLDHHRKVRQGAAEVIYGAGKTPEQIGGIIDAMRANGQNRVLITRMSPEAAAYVGMEGALASVVGGLAECPVSAVPTSVGYGASFGGVAALLSMLNSCASGVSVVNIDNGFGAGYLANMINHMEVKG